MACRYGCTLFYFRNSLWLTHHQKRFFLVSNSQQTTRNATTMGLWSRMVNSLHHDGCGSRKINRFKIQQSRKTFRNPIHLQFNVDSGFLRSSPNCTSSIDNSYYVDPAFNDNSRSKKIRWNSSTLTHPLHNVGNVRHISKCRHRLFK